MGFLMKNIHQLPGILASWVRKLGNPQIATILILLLGAFAIVAAFLPVRGIEGFSKSANQLMVLENISENLTFGFQKHFESPVVWSLVVCLGIGIAISIYSRTKAMLKLRSKNRAAHAAAGQSSASYLFSYQSVDTLTAVSQILNQSGYKTKSKMEWNGLSIHGTKGTPGALGSVLFHASLMLVVVGIVLSRYASFESTFALTEGETFHSTKPNYLSEIAGPYYTSPSDSFSLRSLRVEPKHIVNGAATDASIFEVRSNGRVETTAVFINNGLSVGGRVLHQGPTHGFSPYVAIHREDGSVVFDGFLRLASSGSGAGRVHRDFVEFSSENLRLEFELLPDVAWRDSKWVSISDDAKKPALHLIVLKNKILAGETTTGLGNDANVAGYRLYFGDLRRWSSLAASDDRGLLPLVIAIILGFVGLAIRLLSVRREVAVRLSHSSIDQTYELFGSTEKFRRSFEEELTSLRHQFDTLLVQRKSSLSSTKDSIFHTRSSVIVP